MNCSARQKSFTLIEMLVVIVIISILIGILIPALNKARSQARNVVCKNNLKNLHVAAMSYLFNESGNYFVSTTNYFDPATGRGNVRGWVSTINYQEGADTEPPVPFIPGDPSPWWGAQAKHSITNGAIWPYVGKSLKCYMCPEFDRLCSVGGRVRSYAMNRRAHAKLPRDRQTSINNVDYASRMVMFADVSHTNMYNGQQIAVRGWFDTGAAEQLAGDGVLNPEKDGNNDWSIESIAPFHNGKGNAVFMDGHIELLSPSQTTNACWGEM